MHASRAARMMIWALPSGAECYGGPSVSLESRPTPVGNPASSRSTQRRTELRYPCRAGNSIHRLRATRSLPTTRIEAYIGLAAPPRKHHWQRHVAQAT